MSGAKSQTEERVHDALRDALPAEYRLYPNVRWIHKEYRDAPARDGETDLVIVHPELGLLIVETKGGSIRRDGQGHWWSGSNALRPAPFEQAEASKHALVRKLAELPDWPGGERDIRAGHAVAFPDVDLSTVAHPERGLGPDAPMALVLDRATLGSAAEVRAWVESAYQHWVGDGRRGRSLGAAELAIADEVFSPPPVEIRSALRQDIEVGEVDVVTLTRGQYVVLNTLKSQRRAAIVGPAGCGKTLLAAEKARRLAREGFRTLLVCFNQPLAKMLADELAGSAAKGGALDEGQDFERSWLESLDLLLRKPGEGVLYVFHDPGQALYRDDVVGVLELPEFSIDWNCRNPAPIHEYAASHVSGLEDVAVLREEGRAPEVIKAATARETTEALRKVLHRLVVSERVPREQIVVLTGRSLAKSEVWHQRRFGDQVLWNGSYDDAGHNLGASAAEAPEQPSETILCDSIRRFKGLEREVVVLAEIEPDDPRLDQLLYVGATRARQHLLVIQTTG